MRSFVPELLLAALLLGVTGASAQTKRLPVPGEVLVVGRRTAFVIEPERASRREGRMPWVWYAPTLPRLPGKAETWMFKRFLAKGIAIAGIDVGESYGSPAGRRSYETFYDHLTRQRGYAKKPVLLARSRGGLMLYSWAVQHPDCVAGVAGIYPVCNVASYPGLKRAAPAFGLIESELKKSLAKHNPIERLAALAQARVPVLHIHGDRDRPVPLAANSAELRKRYAAMGGPVEILVQKGRGHDMWSGWFQSQRLTNFAIGCALGQWRASARKIAAGVAVNVFDRHVDVDSRVCSRKGVLQHIACVRPADAATSILRLDAATRDVRAALLQVGAKPGPNGDRIAVSLVVSTKSGRHLERSIDAFLATVGDAELAPVARFPSRSFLVADSGAAPEAPETAVSIRPSSRALLRLQTVPQQKWMVHAAHLPPLGTKVVLRLRVVRRVEKR